MTNANPSIDPANLDTLTGAFRAIFKKFMQGVDGMMPCQVVSFSRDNPNRVQVQHLIFQLTTNGAQVSRGQIASLPVFQYGGGGFVLTFNLNPGDLGWVKANDRDISQFTQGGKAAQPNTHRIKNFSDGVFFPDQMMGYEVAPEDESNAVLQSLDGTVKISLSSNKIKIVAPTVEIDASTAGVITTPTFTVNGALVVTGGITGSGGAGNTAVLTGNVRVVGDIAATGSITPDVPP